jgi:hypothetical protein
VLDLLRIEEPEPHHVEAAQTGRRPGFEYKNGSTAIFITWDEGEGGHYAKGEHCAASTSDVSCHIATLVISPSTKKGARSGTRFNHYSLLGTAEQLLHLSKLGQAASSPTMTKAFNL